MKGEMAENIWHLNRISEPAPQITFLPPRIVHTPVSAVTHVGMFIFEPIDHLVPFTSVSRSVLPFQENDISERAKPADGEIHEHDPMAKTIPRQILCSILHEGVINQSLRGIRELRAHTTLDVTAPFRLALHRMFHLPELSRIDWTDSQHKGHGDCSATFI
jgi:hypothetical protein